MLFHEHVCAHTPMSTRSAHAMKACFTQVITGIIEIVNETLLGCLRHQGQGLDARPDHQRYAMQQVLEAAWGVLSACFRSEDLRSLAAPEAWHCNPGLS